MRMTNITDGTSNTAFISELLIIPASGGSEDWRGVMQYPEGPIYQHNFTTNSSSADSFRTDFCVSIQEAPCTGTYPSWNTRQVILTARSRRVNGFYVGIVDGSVRFAWRAASTPKGGAPGGDSLLSGKWSLERFAALKPTPEKNLRTAPRATTGPKKVVARDRSASARKFQLVPTLRECHPQDLRCCGQAGRDRSCQQGVSGLSNRLKWHC
jgi:hypothetical protein